MIPIFSKATPLVTANKCLQPASCVFFLHNAKTAGRTLNDYLRRVFKEDERFISSGLADLARFTARTKEHVSKLKFVSGHFPFGFHEPLFSDYTYITILREPVNRIASFYYYTKRSPQERDCKRINENNVSLEEYVASGMAKENDNGQTRRVSGVGMRAGFGMCSKEMLNTAKANIENHFAVVGLQERFDETLALLKHAFNWPDAPYANQNITNRPSKESLSAETVNVIKQHNLLDMELYEWVRERFEERWDRFKNED